MKKFFFFGLCSLSLVFACTNDGDSNASAKTTFDQSARLGIIDVATAKQMYINMTATQDYIDFKKSIKDFNALLGGKNAVSFDTKAKWLTWINTNLSLTSFQSVNHFETMFDDMVSKAQILLDANSDLFEFIGKADKNEIIIVVAPEIGDGTVPEHTYSPSSCLDDCIEAYELADAEVREEYFDSLDYPAGDIFSAIFLGMSLREYEHMIYEVLPLQFNDCASGCD